MYNSLPKMIDYSLCRRHRSDEAPNVTKNVEDLFSVLTHDNILKLMQLLHIRNHYNGVIQFFFIDLTF